MRILFIFTSVSRSLQGDVIGWSIPDAAGPYNILSKQGHTIDFAAPGGPNPPMDPSSKTEYKDDEDCKHFLEDSKAQSLLRNAKAVNNDLRSDNYEVVVYVGGRGAEIDLPEHGRSIELVEEFYRSGKLVCAIGHGVAALVFAARDDGVSIFNGKEVTGISDEEEHQGGRLRPFSVERRIRLLGGTYVKADKPWDPKVVRCGNLITGQNPDSARPLAEKVKEILQRGNA